MDELEDLPPAKDDVKIPAPDEVPSRDEGTDPAQEPGEEPA